MSLLIQLVLGSIILRSDRIVYEGSGTVTLPEIRLTEATALGSDYVGFKPPISITTSTVWVLPWCRWYNWPSS